MGVESAALAAIRHKDNDIKRLDYLLEAMANTTSRSDGAAPHRAFHKAIAEVSITPILLRLNDTSMKNYGKYLSILVIVRWKWI